MLPLQKSQLVLENIIQYSFDEIFVTTKDGTIIYSSDSFKKTFLELMQRRLSIKMCLF